MRFKPRRESIDKKSRIQIFWIMSELQYFLIGGVKVDLYGIDGKKVLLFCSMFIPA